MSKISPVTDNFIKAFRHLLCEERKKRGLSQFELAKRCGLSRQCMSLFESGRRAPTLFSLLSLAKGLDLPLIKFISMLEGKVDYYEQYYNNQSMAADVDKKPKWKT